MRPTRLPARCCGVSPIRTATARLGINSPLNQASSDSDLLCSPPCPPRRNQVKAGHVVVSTNTEASAKAGHSCFVTPLLQRFNDSHFTVHGSRCNDVTL